MAHIDVVSLIDFESAVVLYQLCYRLSLELELSFEELNDLERISFEGYEE